MMTVNKRYQAIFFDFDGVLVESLKIKTEAFRELFKEFGEDVVKKVVAHHLAKTGVARSIKIKEAYERFLGVALSDDAIAKLAQTYSDLVETKVIACAWVPGAKELLEDLVGDIPLFIVSGTPQDELERIVSARRMERYFASVHGSPRKKADILATLLELHKLQADNCLMIGDGLTDLNAADQVSMNFLGRLRPDGLNSFPEGTTTVRDLWGVTTNFQ